MLYRASCTRGDSTDYLLGLPRGLTFNSDRAGFEEHSVSVGRCVVSVLEDVDSMDWMSQETHCKTLQASQDSRGRNVVIGILALLASRVQM